SLCERASRSRSAGHAAGHQRGSLLPRSRPLWRSRAAPSSDRLRGLPSRAGQPAEATLSLGAAGSRQALAIAYAIGLMPALVMAVAQPVWSRGDEEAHFAVITQYEPAVDPHASAA